MAYDKYPGGGPLQMRIELQAFTLQPDDGGGHTKKWDTVKTVWASVKPMSSYEVSIGMQPQTEVSHKVCVRKMTIDTGWRIKWGDRYFSIQSAYDVDEARRYMEMKTKERAEKFFES